MERLELTAAEAHDALNDARNAAQICRFLDMALGLEMYDTFKKPKRQSDDEVASASSRKSYRTRIEAMRAIELTSFVCNECGETVKKVSTMRDAIGDLPSLDPDVTDITEEERKKLFPDYEKKRLEGLAISKWHYPPRHKIRHVIAMMHTPEGCTAWDNEVYYPTLADGTKSKGYRNTYKRQWWDKPAYTVTKYTSRLGSQENGHPGMNLTGFDDEERRIYSDARVLSIFELMRVSSLPDDWNIPSWASSNLIREILGEGVPPRLMESAIIALENEINEQN
ncbi:MAG: DNA cytosine methyltransferase [Ruminococcaceae bacterium]|nr:DNA cytosine methyltransferase [Oscillospiraceae bacterium]